METEWKLRFSSLSSTLDTGFAISSSSLSASDQQDVTLSLNCESQLCPNEESDPSPQQRGGAPPGGAGGSPRVDGTSDGQLCKTNLLAPPSPRLESLPVFNADPLHWRGNGCGSICVSPPRSPPVPPTAETLSTEARGHHQPSPGASNCFAVDLLDNLCSTPLSGLKNLQVHWYKPTEISAIAHQSIEEATDHSGVLKIASALEDTSDIQPHHVEPALVQEPKG